MSIKMLRLSPSQIRLYELCPGFRKEDMTSEAAAEGTMLHAAVENRDYTGLDAEQRRAVEFCIGNVDATLMVLAKGAPVVTMNHPSLRQVQEFLCDHPDKVLHIQEMFLPDVGGIQGGTIDDIVIAGKEAGITDFKFGRAVVDPPETNRQLMAYALLFLSYFPYIEKAHVRLLCPRQETDVCDGDEIQPEVATTYTHADLDRIRMQFHAIQSNVRNPRHKLTPNDKSCLYCRRKNDCEALGRLATSTLGNYTELVPPEGFDPRGMLRPQDRAYLQLATKVLEEWGKAIRKSNLDAVLTNNETIPGFALRRRAGNPRFTSALEAFDAAVQAGVSPRDFIAALNPSVNAVTAAVEASAKMRGEDADEVAKKFKDTLESAGLITRESDVFYLQKVNTTKKATKETNLLEELTTPRNLETQGTQDNG